MKKLNNRGFVLIETLVVTSFVMAIFAILYNNFYPLIGEYEKREVFDDIDSKYATYWVKRILQDISVDFSGHVNDLNSNGYFIFDCSMVSDESKKAICNNLVGKDKNRLSVNYNGNTPSIYVLTYNTTKFKNAVDRGSFSGGLKKYVDYLPVYRTPSLNNSQYRVVIEFRREIDKIDDKEDYYYTYSTFEVKK